MPPSGLELERNSLARWLSDTFPGARIHAGTVAQGFKRPAFLMETPRGLPSAILPGAQSRQTALNLTYFGDLAEVDGGRPWAPVALAGRLEEALQAIRHRIPLRDAAGAQTGLLAVTVEWAARGNSDTDLSITLRYRRAVWDRRPELEGETITDITFRHTEV